jgi:hypothetical protein
VTPESGTFDHALSRAVRSINQTHLRRILCYVPSLCSPGILLLLIQIAPLCSHQETFWLLNRLSEPWNTILGSLMTLRLAKTVRGFLMTIRVVVTSFVFLENLPLSLLFRFHLEFILTTRHDRTAQKSWVLLLGLKDLSSNFFCLSAR